MDLHLLLPDELEVECRIRHLKGNPTDVINQLENALKLEEGMASLRPFKMHLAARKKPKHEIKKCSSKLADLKLEIENLDSQEVNTVQLRRLESRFIHLTDRLSRAQTSPTYRKEATELLDTAQKLLLKVQSVMQDETNLDQTLNEVKEIQLGDPEELSESDDGDVPPVFIYSAISKLKHYDDVNSTPITNINPQEQSELSINQNLPGTNNVEPQNMFVKPNIVNDKPSGSAAEAKSVPEVVTAGSAIPPQPNPLRKYMSDTRTLARAGISYDGSPNSVPIELFIFQLETLAQSLNLSEELLFTEICFVLKGNALQYYWTYRRSNPNSTWGIFRNDLIDRFKDRRTEFELRRLVESRKQHNKESFLNFYNDVWRLTLQCKKTYTEEDLIDVLRLNMQPALQLNLTDRTFENVQDLIKSATAWETTWSRLGVSPDFSITTRKSIHELQMENQRLENASSPVQGYHESAPADVSMSMDYNKQNVAQLNLTRPSTSKGINPNSLAICFNCDDFGHSFQNCQLPRRRFCYKCGYKGVTVSDCPKCSGNAQRDQMYPGNLSITRNVTSAQNPNKTCHSELELHQQNGNNGKSNP